MIRLKCPHCGFEGNTSFLRLGDLSGGMYIFTNVLNVIIDLDIKLIQRVGRKAIL